MALDLRSSELEHGFIKERVNSVEKYISELNAKISAYMRKLANLRDSGDELSKALCQFAGKEVLNQSLRASLLQFSDILCTVEDYRDAQVNRLEARIVMELSSYSSLCKRAREDLKKNFDTRAREINKQNTLEKLRGKKPTNWQNIAQAENEAKQAQDEATRSAFELAKQIDAFEKQKIEDIKRVFLEFIKIEMLFHAKALELYSKAHNVVDSIKVEDDLKEFRNHFKVYSVPVNGESDSRAEGACANPSPVEPPQKPKSKRRVRSPFLTMSSSLNANSSSSLDDQNL